MAGGNFKCTVKILIENIEMESTPPGVANLLLQNKTKSGPFILNHSFSFLFKILLVKMLAGQKSHLRWLTVTLLGHLNTEASLMFFLNEREERKVYTRFLKGCLI